MISKTYTVNISAPEWNTEGIIWFLREMDGVINFHLDRTIGGVQTWEIVCDEFSLFNIVLRLNARIIKEDI